MKCCLRLCRWTAAGRWIAYALVINNNNFIYTARFLKQSFVGCRKYTHTKKMNKKHERKKLFLLKSSLHGLI